MKKKNIILSMILFLSLAVVPPSYALNIVDALLCKKVVLMAGREEILVNRVTGNVKYVRAGKKWVPLKGALKTRCQILYKLQASRCRR